MVTMNGNDRHLCSGGAPGKDAVALEIPRPLGMACGPPVIVNRMVRRWISRQAFGTERFSSPAE
jgi:hypothetical protein